MDSQTTDNLTMIQTLNIPSIDPFVVIVLLLLLLAGAGYAWLVRCLRRRNRQHGYTAWLVVVGDLIVTAGFALVAGIDAAVLLVLCLTAAGVPMIIEYIDDHLREQESERRLDI
jgi:hypothetical protein